MYLSGEYESESSSGNSETSLPSLCSSRCSATKRRSDTACTASSSNSRSKRLYTPPFHSESRCILRKVCAEGNLNYCGESSKVDIARISGPRVLLSPAAGRKIDEMLSLINCVDAAFLHESSFSLMEFTAKRGPGEAYKEVKSARIRSLLGAAHHNEEKDRLRCLAPSLPPPPPPPSA